MQGAEGLLLKIALAQINPTVGDLSGNARKILEYVTQAQNAGADIVGDWHTL